MHPSGAEIFTRVDSLLEDVEASIEGQVWDQMDRESKIKVFRLRPCFIETDDAIVQHMELDIAESLNRSSTPSDYS
jgi:hypothetical protein